MSVFLAVRGLGGTQATSSSMPRAVKQATGWFPARQQTRGKTVCGYGQVPWRHLGSISLFHGICPCVTETLASVHRNSGPHFLAPAVGLDGVRLLLTWG